jgi:hypothetical protein
MSMLPRSTPNRRFLAFVAALAAPIVAFGALVLPKAMSTPDRAPVGITPTLLKEHVDGRQYGVDRRRGCERDKKPPPLWNTSDPSI